MNYFSLREILFGILLLASGGAFTAVLYTVLKLCLLLRGELAFFAVRIFKNRFYLSPFRIKRMKKAPNVGRFGNAILDFFATLSLFLCFLLASYAAFDGVFRFIFLLPPVVVFLILCRFLMPIIEKWLFFVIEAILSVLESFLSVPVFLIAVILRVLKRPILFILNIMGRFIKRRISARRRAAFLRSLKSALEKTF